MIALDNCLLIGVGHLDRPEPWAWLHQIEEIDIRCSEGQMDHLFVGIEIGDLRFSANSSKSHIASSNFGSNIFIDTLLHIFV